MNKIKILQLNVWGGRIKDGLSRFISDGDFDLICIQEAVWEENETGFLDLFIDSVDKIKREAGFLYDFRSSNFGVKFLSGETQLEHGNVILSKLPFLESVEKVVVGDYGVASNIDNFEQSISKHRYTAQKVVLQNGVVVVNYHGYWLKDPLGDEVSEDCMRQVADLIRDESRPVVMCGDLNVIAESPAMRKLDFLHDLTALNHVKTTLRNVRFVKDVACDHILVNDKVKFENFQVIDSVVSDHKALAIDIAV